MSGLYEADRVIPDPFRTICTVGSFAIDAKPLVFRHCRENFAAEFKENTVALFVKTNSNSQTAEFIWRTEDILGQQKSAFAKTNIDSILWVRPTDFWKLCPMRRSLFTILLRAGNEYKEESDNYEEALFSNPLAKVCQRSIMRFLFGFTDYVGPVPPQSGAVIMRGWVTVFSRKDDSYIRDKLVKPNRLCYSGRRDQINALCF